MKRASTLLKVVKGEQAPGVRVIAGEPVVAGTVCFRIRGHKAVDTPSYQTDRRH